MSSFSHAIQTQDRSRSSSARPSFSSHNTSDRLREGERKSSTPKSSIRVPRNSVFKEVGLDNLDDDVHHSQVAKEAAVPDVEIEHPKQQSITFDDIVKDVEKSEKTEKKSSNQAWLSKIGKVTRPMIKTSSSAPPGSLTTIPRLALIAILIAVVVPGFRPSGGEESVIVGGVNAGITRTAKLVESWSTIEGRTDGPTDICTRWGHQSKLARLRRILDIGLCRRDADQIAAAVVNGTLYIYGGEATTYSGQTSDTWSRFLLPLISLSRDCANI